MKKCDDTVKRTASGEIWHRAKKMIREAVKECRDPETFIAKMKENNISVIFRKNNSGRIYGVTFIDHNLKMVYNGSRIGKEFSANKFNTLFTQVETNNPDTLLYNPYDDIYNSVSIGNAEAFDLFSFLMQDDSVDEPQNLMIKQRKRKKKQTIH